MNVLLVDDHALIREALRGVFTEIAAGASLLEACDCRTALQLLVAEPDIQLALLDLKLPDGDGMTLLREFRERHPTIAVVVLSAHNDRELVLRALEAGAVGFIPKSASRPVMVHALRLALAGGTYIPPEALARPPLGNTREEVRPTPAELGLTHRQLEVLALIMQGKSNKWICRSLDLAEATVKHHVTSILKALNVTNRTEAVVAVAALGWDLPKIS